MSSVPYSRLLESDERCRRLLEERDKGNHGNRRRQSKHRKHCDCSDKEAEDEEDTFCKHRERHAQRPNSNRNRRDSSTPTQKPADKTWREHSAGCDRRKGDRCQDTPRKRKEFAECVAKDAPARDGVFPVDRIIRSLLDSVSHRDAGCLSFSVDYHKRKLADSKIREASLCRDDLIGPRPRGHCPHGRETREQSTHVSKRHRHCGNESTNDHHRKSHERRVRFQWSSDEHGSAPRRNQHRDTPELHDQYLGATDQGRRHRREKRRKDPQSDESNTSFQTTHFDSPTVDELNLTPQVLVQNPIPRKKPPLPDTEFKYKIPPPGDSSTRRQKRVAVDGHLPHQKRELDAKQPEPTHIMNPKLKKCLLDNQQHKPSDLENRSPQMNNPDGQQPVTADLENQQSRLTGRDDRRSNPTDLDNQQPQTTCKDDENPNASDVHYQQTKLNIKETCNSQVNEDICTQSQVNEDMNLCADATGAENVDAFPRDPTESGFKSPAIETASAQRQEVGDHAVSESQDDAPALSTEIHPSDARPVQEEHHSPQNHHLSEPSTELTVTQFQQEDACRADNKPDENIPQTTNANCYDVVQTTNRLYKPESPILKSPNRHPPRDESNEKSNEHAKDQNGAKARKTRKRITFCDTPTTFYPDDLPLFEPTELKFSEEISGVESTQKTSSADLEPDQIKAESLRVKPGNEVNKSIPSGDRSESDGDYILIDGEWREVKRGNVKHSPENTQCSKEFDVINEQCLRVRPPFEMNEKIRVGDSICVNETGCSDGARFENNRHIASPCCQFKAHNQTLVNSYFNTSPEKLVDKNDDFGILDKIFDDPNRNSETCRFRFSDKSPTMESTKRKLSFNPFYSEFNEKRNEYSDQEINDTSCGMFKTGHQIKSPCLQSGNLKFGITQTKNVSGNLDNCVRKFISPHSGKAKNTIAQNESNVFYSNTLFQPGESIGGEDNFYMDDRSLSKVGVTPPVNARENGEHQNRQLFDPSSGGMMFLKSRNPEQICCSPEDIFEQRKRCKTLLNTNSKNSFLNKPCSEMRTRIMESYSTQDLNRDVAETVPRPARWPVSYKVKGHPEAGGAGRGEEWASRRPGLVPAPASGGGRDTVCFRIHHQINRLVSATAMVDGEVPVLRHGEESERASDANQGMDYNVLDRDGLTEPVHSNGIYSDYMSEPLHSNVTFSEYITEPLHSNTNEFDYETFHLSINGSTAERLKDTQVSPKITNRTFETECPLSFHTKVLTANIGTPFADSVRKRPVFVSELTRDPPKTISQRLDAERVTSYSRPVGETRGEAPHEETEEIAERSYIESHPELVSSPECDHVMDRAHATSILTAPTLQCRTNLKMLSLFSNDFASVLSLRDIEFFDTYIRPMALDYVSVMDKEKVTLALTEKTTSPPPPPPPTRLPSVYEIRGEEEDPDETEIAPETDVFSEIELGRAEMYSPKREPPEQRRAKKKKKRSVTLKLRNFLSEKDIRERPFWVRGGGRRVVRTTSPGNPFVVYEDEVYISSLDASQDATAAAESAGRSYTTAGAPMASPGRGETIVPGSSAALGAVSNFAPETLVHSGAADSKNSNFVSDRLDGISRRLSETELKIVECRKGVEEKLDIFLSQLLQQPQSGPAECHNNASLEEKLELVSRKLLDAESKISETGRSVEDKLESLSRRLFESECVGDTRCNSNPFETEAKTDAMPVDGSMDLLENRSDGSQPVPAAETSTPATRAVSSHLPRAMTLLCASTSGVAFGWLLSLARRCAENGSVSPLVDVNSALAEVGSPFADSPMDLAMESLYMEEELYWPDNHDIYLW